MATTWKDRMWHLFLVCVLGVVVSVCTSSTSSKKGTAYADFKPSDVSAVIRCVNSTANSGSAYYYNCDASDTTVFTTISNSAYAITFDDLIAAGWRPCVNGTYFCK